MNTKEMNKRLAEIAGVFPASIDTVRVHDNGEDSVVIEINGEWMFRFPRHEYARQALACEKQFLPRLAQLSSIPIPEPRYLGKDFVGYRKIPGVPLNRGLFQTFPLSTRTGIARQIGEFFSVVHAFPVAEARAMGVLESWGGWPEKAFDGSIADVAPRLSAKARKNSLEFFDCYFGMSYRRVVIHGDFYPPDHVFFDDERQQLSGVIDFSDLTIEDNATDFKSIYADYGEDFFDAVLAHYTGEVDDHLIDRIRLRIRAHPLLDAVYALEYHQPERFERQVAAIEATFGTK